MIATETRESSEHDVDLPPEPILTTAETAECECPEFCERDHDRD